MNPTRGGTRQPLLEQEVAWFYVYLVKEFNMEKLASFFTK